MNSVRVCLPLGLGFRVVECRFKEGGYEVRVEVTVTVTVYMDYG